MKIYQLDECINSKKLERKCNTEQKVCLYRYPKNNRGDSDPEMLIKLLPKGNTIITSDINIIYDHIDSIPQNHPGIIIIGYSTSKPSANSLKKILIILEKIKKIYKNWNKIEINNSIIIISDINIKIFHKENKKLINDLDEKLNHLNIKNKIDKVIIKNWE